MSSPGDRLKNWIDGLGEAWKDRLRGWMASWLMRGFEELMDSMEPEAIDLVHDNLLKIRDDPDTPQEFKDLMEEPAFDWCTDWPITAGVWEGMRYRK